MDWIRNSAAIVLWSIYLTLLFAWLDDLFFKVIKKIWW